MLDSTRLRFLRQIAGFDDLPDSDLGLLSQAVNPARYPAGTILAREGEVCDRVYQLVSGIVQVRRGEQSGDGTSPTVLMAGEIFGDRGLRLGRPELAAAVALSDVELLTFARKDFEQALREHPAIAIGLMQALAAKVERQPAEQGALEMDQRGRVLAIVGLEAQIGRTTVAINLSTAIAQLTRSRVLLLDPNLSAVAIPRALGISADADYVDALLRGSSPDTERMTWMTKGGFWTVLPPRRRASSLGESHLIAAFLALARAFDYIVVDSSSPRAGLNRALMQVADRIVLVNRNSESRPESDRTQFERSVLEPHGIRPDRLVCTLNLMRPDPEPKVPREWLVLPCATELLSDCAQRRTVGLLEDPECDFSRATRELARRLIFDHRLRISIPARHWTPGQHEEATGRLQRFLGGRFNDVVVETVPVDAEESTLGVGAWATQAVLSEHMEETVGFLGTLKGDLAIPYLSFEINGRPNLI